MSDRRHLRSALAAAGPDRIIYDLTGIEGQYDALLGELPGVRVRFAMKACPVDEVLAALADRGAGFDAASTGEIRQALSIGATPRTIHYGNTVKSDADIALAHRMGITTYATDCLEDVRAIATHAPGARVFCRLSTSGEGALWGLTGKFGSDDPVAVLVEARRLGLVPAGLSVHVGSQQMTAYAWQHALEDLVALLPGLVRRGIRIDHVNLGGGLPAAGHLDRDGNALHPPIAEIFAVIRAGMNRLRATAGGDLAFVIEPGRHLVADHGAISARVARLTERRQPWLYLTCGRYNGLYEGDQLHYRMEFPTRTGDRRVAAVIAGPTCDSDDRLGAAPVTVPAGLASGDPVWIHSAGAYATSYMTCGFNGFDPLPCVTVRRERVRPITPRDWTAITALEANAYLAKGISESRVVLESRANSSPATSFVLDVGHRVSGYLLALPYPPARLPDPARPEETVFRSPNLHLHDIVVGVDLRGRGWAKRMLHHLTEAARSLHFQQISLVAVGGTTGFWLSRGYRPQPGIALPSGYGTDAIYMTRPIDT